MPETIPLIAQDSAFEPVGIAYARVSRHPFSIPYFFRIVLFGYEIGCRDFQKILPCPPARNMTPEI